MDFLSFGDCALNGTDLVETVNLSFIEFDNFISEFIWLLILMAHVFLLLLQHGIGAFDRILQRFTLLLQMANL